jgi:aryl-alcohol dehydrogenase-like predicted oxidoreductase
LITSTVGLGTIGWGDEKAGFNSRYRATDIREAFDAACEGGINFFDTAEVCGYQQHKYQQSSECLLGDFDRDSGAKDRPVIGSKVFTIPWTNLLVGGSPRLGREALVEAIKASVARVGRPLDLWSIHFPFPTFKQSVLMDALKEGLDLDLTKAVGVSNYNAKQLEEANELCDKASVPLACNQVSYNLLDRKAEKDGLLRLAEQLDIAIVAYSPLAGGKLTSNGLNKDPKNAKLAELLKLMDFVGTVNGGKSISQVALNYIVEKGCIPIPSAVNAGQASEHAGAMDWKLDQNEVALLDEKLEYLKF